MHYLSTRGGMSPRTFSEVTIMGLAPDGGLAIPEHYPRVDAATLRHWRDLAYPDLALALMEKFIADIPREDLRALIQRTYTAEVFASAEITPVTPLDEGFYLLELSNGPTLAFKDIAMQFLGNLFEYVLGRRGEELNILGATSGDTGSAAEYAMRGKQGVRVFMLSPHGKMSLFQTAQMFSLDEPNIHNLAVEGVFDDCQDMVKAVNSHAEFKARYRIGAVNSINWARVLAQVVYYFRAYLAVATEGEEIAVSVPSGNFGNIFAGHIARQMGLPLARLILATNENNVLDEFFRTGRYRVRPAEAVWQTSSPSMDIAKASNFERFVYDALDRDAEGVCHLWEQLARTGEIDLSGRGIHRDVARHGFVSGTSTHADRLATIREMDRRYGRLVDTHTADGIKVGREQCPPGMKLVCLETALPAKFAGTIREALGRDPARPAAYADLESRPQRFTVLAPSAAAIEDYIARAVA